MPLTPGEADRLLLHLEASLAQRRRDRGLRLNVPEARALIADAVCEWARDGIGLAEARSRARHLLTVDDVLPGVPAALDEVRVEARFGDGTRLVVVNDPFRADEAAEPAAVVASAGGMASGQTSPSAGDLVLTISNESPTAIGITSHIHLAEVNPRLRLDRESAFGRRLAIETGQAIWIRPGETVEIATRLIEGSRVVVGNSGVIDGPLDDPDVRARALATLRSCGYLDIHEGTTINEVAAADRAIASLMERRNEDRG